MLREFSLMSDDLQTYHLYKYGVQCNREEFKTLKKISRQFICILQGHMELLGIKHGLMSAF